MHKKYQAPIPYSFVYKFVCIDDEFSKSVLLYRGKYEVYRFIKKFLGQYDHCKDCDKKCLNKNLVMSAKSEQIFQSSNKCWICGKLFDEGENKARDHCHVTGKCKGCANWSCNINLKLTKRVAVILHNLRGYCSNLIMQKIDKFDVKVNVIPNG